MKETQQESLEEPGDSAQALGNYSTISQSSGLGAVYSVCAPMHEYVHICLSGFACDCTGVPACVRIGVEARGQSQVSFLM